MGTGSAWAGVPEVKVVPPALPRPLLDRPLLNARLDEVIGRRLATVVAGAGFGKSTLLAVWAARVPAAWYTLGTGDADPLVLARGVFHALRIRIPGLVPEASLSVDAARGPEAEPGDASRPVAFAAFLATALEEHLRGDVVVVLDDVQEIEPGSPAARFIEALCRQAPARLHVVLASRVEPPFRIERLRGQGQLVEITGADLRFTATEVEALLVAELGEEARPLAAEVQRRTEGWPAAVRLAAEALRGVPPQRRQSTLALPGPADDRLFAYLAEEVMTQIDPQIVDLVRTIAPLRRVTADLASALGVAGAGALFDQLDRRGLFLVPQGSRGWYNLHPVVRAYALKHLPLAPAEHTDVLGTAAAWFISAGETEAALTCLEEAGDDMGIARLLTEHGPVLMASGAATRAADAARKLPEQLRTTVIVQLEGEACHVVGQWERALVCLSSLAPPEGPLPASVAWRLGLIHHLRGDLDLALAAYERGTDAMEPPPDRALVLAWAAAVWWLRGDAKRCRELAEAADAEARACGDHRAAAAAQTALAMLAAMEGDRWANDAHYVRALDHAEQAGDALQIIRIRANRGSRYVEEGAYDDALAELEVALRLADVTGFPSVRALALLNRGQALYHLGRLEEAQRDLDASRATFASLGSRMASYALANLGDVHAARGESALARASYEEALAMAEAVGDLQGTVPAHAGLARVLLGEDVDAAQRHAEQAVVPIGSLFHQWALLALGWVVLARGDNAAAANAADRAAARARQRRDPAALAETLELQAAVARAEGAPDVARARLDEAREMHRTLGEPLGQARVDLALASLLDGEPARRLARAVEMHARLLGARALAGAATRLCQELERQARPSLAVDALGGFRVARRLGEPIGPSDWQSRKARDLLKILISRRGRPVRREEIVELLWPDDRAAERLGSRLSVTLSTLRAVLDPDKTFDADHFIATDGPGLRLDLAHLQVDVEVFLDLVRRALAAVGGGEPTSAGMLAEAETAYTGDFLADDPYDDWAVGLREEARGAYLHVARLLAQAAADVGDADSAARYLLRILERDPYDEGAHLGLVRAMAAAGRHGEARRVYRSYWARMEEIGVEPTPFPDLA